MDSLPLARVMLRRAAVVRGLLRSHLSMTAAPRSTSLGRE